MQELSPSIWVACALALITAGGVVLATRPVYAAVALLAHSLVLAALYALLTAQLVAIGQVLIYSGAVVVLFLFVVALLPSGGAEAPAGLGRAIAAGLGGGLLLAALAAAVAGGAPTATAEATGDVAAVGRTLFGALLPAFELTAPLLLVAIVGGVVIWRRHEEAR